MTVAVAYSPNEFGEAALAHGIREAKLRGEDVLVVNAVRGDTTQGAHAPALDDVSAVEQRMSDEGVEFSVVQPVGPDAAELILSAAAEADSSVIVIGIKHRTPIGKLLLGSTAQQILLSAPCDVLAVKPPKK